MSTELVRAARDEMESATPDPEQARSALVHYTATGGDVSKMTNEQRAAFILDYCKSVGLNPRTGPVEIIAFYDPDAKEKVAKVYAKAEAAKQLGDAHRIRVETLAEEMVGNGLFKVSVRGHQPDGRTYDEVGYVSVVDREGAPLRGDRYKNALMKCHTVAKRRLVLGMLGLSSPPERGEARGVQRLYLGPNAELLESPSEEDRYLNDHPDVARAMNRPRFETLPSPAATGLEGMPDQRPRPDVIDPPSSPPGPRPTFHANVDEYRRRWFAIVDGTYLADDDARHHFIGEYTKERWPQAARTESLSVFLRRSTDRQADEMLAYVQAICDREKAQPVATADVPAAVDLAAEQPERPLESETYTRPELFAFYDDWSDYMRTLDASWTPDNVRSVADKALRRKVDDLVAQATDLAEYLAGQLQEDDQPAEAF